MMVANWKKSNLIFEGNNIIIKFQKNLYQEEEGLIVH